MLIDYHFIWDKRRILKSIIVKNEKGDNQIGYIAIIKKKLLLMDKMVPFTNRLVS